MKRNSTVLIVVALLAQVVFSQERNRPREEQRQEFLYYQAINLLSGDSLRARIDIPYRIDAEFFVPVKNNDSSIPWPFVRSGEVAIELVDSLGVSRARAINEVKIGQNTGERRLESKQWYQGAASFSVPPGPYTIQFEVTDQESQRNFMENNRKVRAHQYKRGDFRLTTPFFVEARSGSGFPDTMDVQNFGGDLLFGSPASLFVEIPGTDSDSTITVDYSIALAGRDKDEQPVFTADTTVQPSIIHNLRMDLLAADSGVRYRAVADNSVHADGVLIPLPAEKLNLRLFMLKVHVKRGSSEEHATLPFRTLWPTMPFSLRDVDYALDALRYIVSESQLDSLRRGGFDARREHLENFWKQRDKTPETAYNELETEYYRRVDHASREFGTLRQPDGARSDRGKIYILYGPPSKTDRMLNPDSGFQEVWTYDRIGKKFVFVDQSKSGNYVLSSASGS